jgi:hypothetical protein
MKQIFTLLLSVFFIISSARADDSQITPPSSIGVKEPLPTQRWLELQRSGNAASPQAQPVSGEVMDNIHKRYIKSFERPIPEFYEHAMPTR